MPKGVARALEKAIISKEEDSPSERAKKEGKFQLMNKNRQEIFQYLTRYPGSNTTMISKACGISLHATNWHLRRLEESDYISKKTIGKKTIFYPTGMIAEEDIPLFEILNVDKAKAIYLLIIDKNGISQKDICDILRLKHQAVIWYTKKLQRLGLINSLEDGKFRRYYPTELLIEKKDENTNRLEIFKDGLIKKLQNERLSFAILRSTKDKIVVRIARGKSKTVLTLHLNPFVTVLF